MNRANAPKEQRRRNIADASCSEDFAQGTYRSRDIEEVPQDRLSAPALESSPRYSLRRAQLSTYSQFTAAMEPFDIRPSQFALLMLIQANPGLTQSAISTALGIQKTNFVAMVDKLESRGITERRKVRGGPRSSALHLTQTGAIFVAAVEAARRAMEKQVAKCWARSTARNYPCCCTSSWPDTINPRKFDLFDVDTTATLNI